MIKFSETFEYLTNSDVVIPSLSPFKTSNAAPLIFDDFSASSRADSLMNYSREVLIKKESFRIIPNSFLPTIPLVSELDGK